MNIMLVEDNLTDLKLFSAVLKDSGHHIIEKDSAEQAAAAIGRQALDVIVLDLKLPGMDGLALARRLKADAATRHITIIAITGARESYSQKQVLAAGCDAYITKPVDTRQLSAQLTHAAAQHSSQTKN